MRILSQKNQTTPATLLKKAGGCKRSSSGRCACEHCRTSGKVTSENVALGERSLEKGVPLGHHFANVRLDSAEPLQTKLRLRGSGESSPELSNTATRLVAHSVSGDA